MSPGFWSYPTSGEVVSSPAVDNGTVFVASGDDVYAFGTSSTPTVIPTSTPTPKPTQSPAKILRGISMGIEPGMFQTTYVNQPVQITACPLSGTPPYTYQWDTQLWTNWGSATAQPLGPIIAFPGATSATFTFVESAPGTYDISLNISDSAGDGDYDSFPIAGVWVVVQPLPSPITSTTPSLLPTSTVFSMPSCTPDPTISQSRTASQSSSVQVVYGAVAAIGIVAIIVAALKLIMKEKL